MIIPYRKSVPPRFAAWSGLAAAVLMVAGCFDSDEGVDTGLWPATVDCNTVATEPESIQAADLSPTPRADRTAEILALQATGALIAPEDVYQRVAAELTGIRHRFPDMTGHGVRGCGDPSTLLVEFEDQAFPSVEDGTYDEWDDLNTLFDHQDTDIHSHFSMATLHFNGRYNFGRLGQEYEALSGIKNAAANLPIGDGNDVCMAIRETVHFYIFKLGSGDCPSGCTEERFLAVQVDNSGNIEPVGQWSGVGSPPNWFQNAEDCRAFLPFD